MDRRTVLKAAAIIAAAPTVAFAHDPIIDAISDYRDGLAAYNAETGEDPLTIARTYGPPLAVIKNWSEPAVTNQGAIEALKLAHLEMMDCDAPETVRSMVWAALAYFESEH